jgi:hypothetical protein
VFPFIYPRFQAGDPVAAFWLATGAHHLMHRRDGTFALDWTPQRLWREACRRDPANEDARIGYIEEVLRWVVDSLHELPAGVLDGNIGATQADCEEMLCDVTELRAFLRPDELTAHRELLDKAQFHYAAYRDYLESREHGNMSSYRAFLDDRK